MNNKNQEYITVKGARVHNLKNITVKIPKNKLVVLAGVFTDIRELLAQTSESRLKGFTPSLF